MRGLNRLYRNQGIHNAVSLPYRVEAQTMVMKYFAIFLYFCLRVQDFLCNGKPDELFFLKGGGLRGQ